MQRNIVSVCCQQAVAGLGNRDHSSSPMQALACPVWRSLHQPYGAFVQQHKMNASVLPKAKESTLTLKVDPSSWTTLHAT